MLALVGAFALGVGLLVIDRSLVGAVHDDAMYVILARSLATGEGYRFLNIPGTPPATHFPPGYPALLALLWRLGPGFPENLLLFRAVNAVALAASSVLIARLVRDRFGSEGFALSMAFLVAVSAPLLVLVALVLSEPLFLALLLALLVAGERLVAGPPSPRRAAMLGVGIGLTALVRTHGVVMIPALALPLLWRRRPREALAIAGTASLVLLPWALWSSRYGRGVPAPLLGNYDSYVGWWIRGLHEMGWRMIPETVMRTASESVAMLVTLASPGGGAAARTLTALALLLSGTTGAVVLARRAPVTALALLTYAAIVLVWPFTPARFLWGIWPLLLLVVGAAGWTVRRPRSLPAAARVAVAGALLWVVVGYAEYELRALRGAWWRSLPRASAQRLLPALRWTLAHTRADELLATDDEGAFFLYTGRQSVPVVSFTASHYLRHRSLATEAREGLDAILDAYPVRTVIVGDGRILDVARLLASRSTPRLVLRERLPTGAAFSVLRP